MKLTTNEKYVSLVASIQHTLHCGFKARLQMDLNLEDICFLIELFGGSVSLDESPAENGYWLSYQLLSKTGRFVAHFEMTALAFSLQEGKFSGKHMVFNEPTKLSIADNCYLNV